MNTKISIDNLIDIVAAHGKVKTGVDVYGSNSVLLLAGDVLVEKVRTLEILREAGLSSVSIDTASDGCLLDGHGNLVKINSDELVNIPAFDSQTSDSIFPDIATNEIEMKLVEIEEIKKQAFLK